MQPCRSDQDFAVQRQERRHALCRTRGALYVPPSPRQRLRQRDPRYVPRLARQDHDREPTRLGLGVSGILYGTKTYSDAGPPLLIASGSVGLGLGLLVASLIRGD
jgi:hypothetical protein